MSTNRTSNRTCSIEGCDRRHQGHGYCNLHYQRWLHYGDPLHPGVGRGSTKAAHSGKPITPELVHQLLAYAPDTGTFTWKVGSGRRAIGDVAGGRNADGRTVISIDHHRLLAYRVAWLLTYGEWPQHEIDHINGDSSDNRIANLRPATHRQNMQNIHKARVNNVTGILGAHLDRRTGKYIARIKVNYVAHHLGVYDTAEEAHAAYLEGKARLHPFYVPR